MDKDLLTRYLNDQCEPEEVERVMAWISNPKHSVEVREILEAVWEEFQWEGSSASMDFDDALRKLHQKIELDAGQSRPGLRFREWIVRAAAILFIPVLSLLIYQSVSTSEQVVSWTEVSTPVGGKANFQLPDGTLVWLNFNSSIRYPLSFSGDMREVELEGEAYFDIAHDEASPFLVKTNPLGVLATGTEFNVLAYPEDTVTQVSLISGEVLLQQLGSGQSRTLYTMKPGQQSTLGRKSRKVSIHTDRNDRATAWLEGKMIFKDDRIDYVFEHLSRWYNADFAWDDPELLQYTFTATLVDETLPQVLELMELATPIEFEIMPRKELTDGSFSRSTIAVKLNN